MGEYHYKVTPDEMESLYAQVGTLSMGGQFSGNMTTDDTGPADEHHSALRKILDNIKDRNHAEQGHPDDAS